VSSSTSDKRVALVTGATSGIGRVTAVELARRGYRVLALGRNRERGAAVLAEIRSASGDGTAELFLCDLAVLSEVRATAAELTRRTRRLDVLVNNAGAIYGRREPTREGFERTFAGNHLGPFLLTNLLLPLIERGAAARIVNVTSAMHTMVRTMAWDDLQLERGFSGSRAYAQSKLANLLFTRELSRRLAGRGIAVNAVRPGVVRSRFGASAGALMRLGINLASPFMLTPVRGADTVLWLASDPELDGRSGGYFIRRAARTPSETARDDESARRLWHLSAAMAGLPAAE
jgi:NAD(P)-dependent dehydrogenase (short-subunit alcohol dehydrogenase family)